MAAPIKDLVQRARELKAARGTWESHWEEIRTYILPLVASFTGADSPGEKNRDLILDNSTESASELLAAGLHGFLTNPGTKWFSLRATRTALNRVASVAAWLEAVTDLMLTVFESPRTQFASQIGSVYQELADFGTTGMYVVERPGRMPLFQARPLSELVFAENNESEIDTVFRFFEMTARQAMQQWPGATMPKIEMAAKDPKSADRKFEFLHATLPRDDGVRGSLASRRLPQASVWVSLEDEAEIRISGFHEMPFMTPRWRKRSDEVYGRGPGTKALADVKMLQRTYKAVIRAAERGISPPLAVADDGVMGALDLRDNGTTIIRQELLNMRRPPIEPLFTGSNPGLGEDFAQAIRVRIERAYYNHLLQLSRDPRMTATQVIKLDEETLRVLGPFLGRVQNELLGPLIARTYGMLARAGALPPPPEELDREQIEVEYVSPIAKAQRLSEVAGVSQLIDVTAPLIDRDPTILDNLNADRTFRNVADRLGVAKDNMRPMDEVAAMRRQRQEVAEEEAALQTFERGAAASQSAGQAIAALDGVQRIAA